jgi:hypothetical protein
MSEEKYQATLKIIKPLVISESIDTLIEVTSKDYNTFSAIMKAIHEVIDNE